MVEPIYAEIGRRIDELRKRKDMSQAMLAQRLSPPLTRATVSNMEKGRQRLLVHTLLQIAAILEVQVQDLLPTAALLSAATPAVAAIDQDLERQGIPAEARQRLANMLQGNTPRIGQ